MMAPSEEHSPIDRGPRASNGDQIAVCFDLDGTVYRSSSVFIESLALLPYYLDCEPADIGHLHTCIGIVAEYTRGETAKRRVKRLLRVVERLRTTVSARLSKTLMKFIISLAFRESPTSRTIPWRSSTTGQNTDAETISYACMQERVLNTYGDFLEGRDASAIEAAVASLVHSEIPVDSGMVSLFDRLDAEANATVYLLTDVPDHMARAYMEKLGQSPDHVKATRYATTADQQFTGEVQPTAKQTDLERIRDCEDVDYVIAGGDSEADLAMSDIADLFFAIEGRGDIEDALENIDPGQIHTSDRTSRDQIDSSHNIVHIKSDEQVSEVVESTLESLGILD